MRFALCCALMILGAPSPAEAEVPSDTVAAEPEGPATPVAPAGIQPVERWTLDDGTDVLLVRDHRVELNRHRRASGDAPNTAR